MNKSNVDLSSNFGSIRDQSDIGWCYAFAGADMLSFFLHRDGLLSKDQYLSATYLALDYTKFSRDDMLGKYYFDNKKRFEENQKSFWVPDSQSGYGEDIVNFFDGPFCTEDAMPQNVDLGQKLKPIYMYFLSGKNNLYLNAAISATKEMFPYSDELNIYLSYLNWTPEKQNPISKLVKQTCLRTIESRQKIWFRRFYNSSYSPSYTDFKGDRYSANFLENIDDELSAGRPALIGYNSRRLFHPYDYSYARKHSGHFSLIIGRQYNCADKSDFYILRNSWGVNSCLDQVGANIFENQSLSNPEYNFCLKTCSIGDLGCKRKCTQNYLDSDISHTKFPFYCRNGNFLVKATELESALFDVIVYDENGHSEYPDKQN